MKAFSSLRSLLVVLVLAAITPLFVFAVIRSIANIERDLARSRQNLEFTATAVAHAQERVADSARQLLVSIASVPKLLDRAGGECAVYFRTLGEALHIYTNLGVISANGNMLCHAAATGVGDYAGDREYFQAALARDGFVVSGYLVGRISKKPLVAFAMPIKDVQGRTTAVAFAALHFNELAKAVGDVKLPRGSHLLIMDRAGIVLADNVGASTAVGKLVANPLLQKAIQAGSKGMLEGPDASGKQKMYALAQTTPASDSAFFIAVGLDKDAVLEPARQQLLLSYVVLLLVTSVGCVLAWVLGGRVIVRPTERVLEATSSIQEGHLDARIPITANEPTNELTQIAIGFNHMADTLQQHEADLMLELSRSEQAFQSLDLIINTMQDALIAVNANLQIVLVNDAALRFFDIHSGMAATLVNWPERLGLFVPGTDQLYATEDVPVYKALQGKSGGPQEIWVKNDKVPNGRLFSVRYQSMKDEQGETGALMVYTDITEMAELQEERKNNNAALVESQRQLLEAQRLGQIGHWHIDGPSKLITWSDQLYEIFGVAPGGFGGTQESFLQLVHPEDRARYSALRDQALRDETTLEIEYRIVTPSGQTRWMHQIGQPQVDKDGHTYYRAGVVQEITERKQSELALARSTDLLQRTGEMALIGGWEISFDPLTTHWTDEIFRIHECDPRGGMSARRAIRFFAQEAQPVLRKALRAAMEHGKPWDLELPLITAKGRRIWVRTQGEQVHARGRLVGLSGALQDVTSQHNALVQLRLLETCVSRLNDIVLITEAEPIHNPGPRIVFVNDAFERRTGYSREEVLGKSPRFLQGPKTQRAELDRIDAALKQWQPVRAELINYTKTGEEFWIELDIVPVANDVGWYTHWVAVERDVTQRKLAEQAMRDSEQRYAALFEQAPVPMWVYDAETFRFLTVNSAAVRDYGYSIPEFLSMTIFDIRSKAEAQRLKRHLEEESQDSSHQWDHFRKDGSVFTARGLSKPIQYAGRPARFALALDVSAQVHAEAEVRDYLATLQRAAVATQAITLHLSLDGLLDEVAAQVRTVIGAHQAVVSLCWDNNWVNANHVFSASDKYPDLVVEGSPMSMGGADFYASACETSKVMRLTQTELESHPGWLHAAGFANQRPAMRGWLSVPLVGRSGKTSVFCSCLTSTKVTLPCGTNTWPQSWRSWHRLRLKTPSCWKRSTS